MLGRAITSQLMNIFILARYPPWTDVCLCLSWYKVLWPRFYSKNVIPYHLIGRFFSHQTINEFLKAKTLTRYLYLTLIPARDLRRYVLTAMAINTGPLCWEIRPSFQRGFLVMLWCKPINSSGFEMCNTLRKRWTQLSGRKQRVPLPRYFTLWFELPFVMIWQSNGTRRGVCRISQVTGSYMKTNSSTRYQMAPLRESWRTGLKISYSLWRGSRWIHMS